MVKSEMKDWSIVPCVIDHYPTEETICFCYMGVSQPKLKPRTVFVAPAETHRVPMRFAMSHILTHVHQLLTTRYQHIEILLQRTWVEWERHQHQPTLIQGRKSDFLWICHICTGNFMVSHGEPLWTTNPGIPICGTWTLETHKNHPYSSFEMSLLDSQTSLAYLWIIVPFADVVYIYIHICVFLRDQIPILNPFSLQTLPPEWQRCGDRIPCKEFPETPLWYMLMTHVTRQAAAKETRQPVPLRRSGGTLRYEIQQVFEGSCETLNLLALTSHHAPSAAFMCLSPKCEAPMHFTLVQCSHTSKLFSPLVASRCMLWINKKNLGIEHLLEDHKQKCLRCCSLTFLACMETTKPSNEWPWNIFQSKHLQALNETAQSKRHLVVHEFHVQLSSVQRHGRNLVPVYCLLGMSSGVSK